MTRKLLRASLLGYARELHAAHYDYSPILSDSGHGLEIVFDGLVEWSLNVKVRRAGSFFGVETKEHHEIFCRGIRTHIVSSSLAKDLLESREDVALAIEEDHIVYNDRLYGPDVVSWPNSIYDREKAEGDAPEFLQTNSTTQNLKLIVAPDEDAVLISRYIKGFEGHETSLASIRRRKEAFRDGSEWYEDPLLEGIELKGEAKVLFNGEIILGDDRRWLLRNASRLFPSH
jgi:hypothetical protein